jgi:cytochrome P450
MRITSDSFPASLLPRSVPSGIPGPRGLPWIGSFLEARRDILGLLERGVRDHGRLVRYRMGPFTLVLAHDPDDVRHVLVKNHTNYRKSPSYAVLREVLGNGLVTSEGDFWRRQRKLAQPAFHHKSLVGFAETMGRLAGELAGEWELAAGSVDLHHEMMRLTLRIVGHTLMSTELGGDVNTIGRAIEVVLDYTNEIEAFLFLPSWLPTRGKIRTRRAVAELDEVVYRLIGERRASGDYGTDLLGMLMAATDESDDSQMTDRQLRDEVMTLILAGHETTANALTWTWHLLGQHPEVAAALRRELDEVLGDRLPTLADVKQLPYTEAVIKESMRIYPPVWMIERQAIGADTIGGYPIAPDTLVAVSPWTLHRDPSIYPDPERFDPGRFLGDAGAERHRYAYLPFGGGPRTCIGNSFALMEATIVLATLAGRFDVTPISKQAVLPQPSVTLRPASPIRARVQRRARD